MKPALLFRSRIISALGLATFAGAIAGCQTSEAQIIEGSLASGSGVAADGTGTEPTGTGTQAVGSGAEPVGSGAELAGTAQIPAGDSVHAEEVSADNRRDLQPGCLSGEFCMTAGEARAIARDGGNTRGDCVDVDLGHPDHVGSPDVPQGTSLRATYSPSRTRARSTSDEPLCCYTWLGDCGGGRPLLDDGEPTLAPLQMRADWRLDRVTEASLSDLVAALSPADRAWVTAKWLRDAQYEHSSVASFARTAMELMALGAPPDLVAGCHQAALDEIEHAQACFGVAATISGESRGPGPIEIPPTGATSIAEVAVEAFVEGCAGEAFAVLSLHRAQARRPHPFIATTLMRIAEDETTHAILGWQIVAWALREAPDTVRPALVQAASELGRSLALMKESEPDLTLPADPVLRCFACLPPNIYADVRREAWTQTIAPALQILLAAQAQNEPEV